MKKLSIRFKIGMVSMLLAAVFLFAATASAAPSYLVTDLGQGEATVINNAGQVIVNLCITADCSVRHTFLYSGGTMTDLSTLAGLQSWVTSINDSGQMVGAACFTPDCLTSHAFLYSGGTITDLGTLGGSTSSATVINNLGQVAGVSDISNDTDRHPFLYSGGTMTDLGTLSTTSYSEISVTGINNSGQVVGSSNYSHYELPHAFLFDGTKMRDLGAAWIVAGGFPGISMAYGINDNSQVVGQSDTFDSEQQIRDPFLYSGGIWTDLGNLGVSGKANKAYSINNSGQIVGISRNYDLEVHAFLYTLGTMYDLNSLITSSSGLVLVEARGINNYGQIIGNGSLNDYQHAFLLTPFAAATMTTADTGVPIALGPVELTFSNIESVGTVTAVLVPLASLPVTSYFEILGGTSYAITTDATFSSNVTVCISYDPNGMSVDQQQRLQIIHYNYNTETWEYSSQPITVDNNKVCGVFSSLSPFALAEPTSVPFSTLSAKLHIHAGPPPSFDLNASFNLGGNSDKINPLAENVSLQVGTYSVTIPAGSFHQLNSGSKKGTYVFSGVVNGVTLSLQIAPPSVTGNGWGFKASGTPVDLTGLSNPVTVVITIGNDSGTTAINASIF